MAELQSGRLRPVVPPLAAQWTPAQRSRRRGTAARRGGTPRDAPTSARQRLLRAVIDQTSVVGFHDVAVNDLCDLCGLSRRTFYNYFPDVPQLFLVAYEDVDASLRNELQRAWDADGDAAAVIDALVSFACADPVRADAFFVQALAAGRPVAERRQRTVDWCVALLTPDGGRVPALAFEIAYGGIWDVLRARVAIGDFAGLRRDASALVSVMTLRDRARTA